MPEPTAPGTITEGPNFGSGGPPPDLGQGSYNADDPGANAPDGGGGGSGAQGGAGSSGGGPGPGNNWGFPQDPNDPGAASGFENLNDPGWDVGWLPTSGTSDPFAFGTPTPFGPLWHGGDEGAPKYNQPNERKRRRRPSRQGLHQFQILVRITRRGHLS